MRRAVIVGCGNMAVAWLTALAQPALAQRVKVVALVDPERDAAEKLKVDFGLADALVAAELEPALCDSRPELVFDIAVPEARREIVLSGFRHNCHVLTEKPMATSLEEAREILDAAGQSGRVHAVTQNRRFKPGIRRVRATIESGVLGDLNAIHSDFFVGAHFGGFRDSMDHVLLLDMAIHTFDAMRFLSGREPVAAYCVEGNPAGSWYAHGSVANAIFEFTGSVVATYRGSWSAEGANTSWDSSWRIVGSRGTLLWDGDSGITAKVVDGDTGFFRPLRNIEIPQPVDGRTVDGHASAIASFLDAIDAGREPETSGRDNIKSLAMVFAAIESAATQRRVLITA